MYSLFLREGIILIIDIHTHTFPDKMAANVIDKLSRTSKSVAFSDGTVGGLIESMKAAGIDLSVILPVATNTHQVEHINNSALSIPNSELISFGCIHPDYENYSAELKRIKSLGLKGIKVHPVYQGTDVDDVKYLRIFECAAELDLVVITHAGLDIGFPGVIRCSPKMCRHVIDEIGDFKFVLAHMGGWKNWEEVPEYLADTKVYLDTAFSTGRITPRADCHWNEKDLVMMNSAQFIDMVEAFGADRILFGTDSPWSSQSESIEFIRQLSISDEDKKKILGENAARILNIE